MLTHEATEAGVVLLDESALLHIRVVGRRHDVVRDLRRLLVDGGLGQERGDELGEEGGLSAFLLGEVGACGGIVLRGGVGLCGCVVRGRCEGDGDGNWCDGRADLWALQTRGEGR